MYESIGRRSEIACDGLIAQRIFNDRLCSRTRPILGSRPEVGVGIERRGGFGVAKGSLDGDDVAACGDEAGCVEVP